MNVSKKIGQEQDVAEIGDEQQFMNIIHRTVKYLAPNDSITISTPLSAITRLDKSDSLCSILSK